LIALDTNVLVRFLLRDDPAQSDLAAKAINVCTIDDPAFIAREVTVELFWVLERAYKIPRRDIATLLQNLLRASRLRFENDASIAFALQGILEKGHDFADQLIAFAGSEIGAKFTLTFDKRAAKIGGMLLLD
jgi:predicted nucleic-acid-binding protein